MLFKSISVINDQFDCIADAYVGTKGDIIAYIGSEAPSDPDSFGEVYDGAGKLLIPAFYNAHAHAAMTLLRGYAENAVLQAWLNDLVFPFEAKMTSEDHYWGTLLACAEMARFGVVGFSDMYFSLADRARAVGESGLKANLCEGFVAFEDKSYREYPQYADNERFVKEFHGAYDGRVLVDYNIHAEYTTNARVVAEIAEIAKDKGLHIHLHASETHSEHEECKQRHNGLTPIQYFNSLGVLDVPVTAAHCVWVEPEDIDLLVEKGVSVALNPASNMKLGSGFAPVPAMLEKGVNLCLGTDGMASNNNHDMLQDIYMLATIYKGANLDPTVVSPKQALAIATRHGALSQGRNDCGLIKEGFKADLAILDMSGPSWTPQVNVLNNLVFAGHGSDVVLTMSDGKVVYRDGEWPTIDVEQAKAQVSERTARIISQL